MDTKEAILETALDLFNRNGASAVSTRHIADEMGISPGNLYYHFRNREEIVRELTRRMIDEFGVMFHAENMSADPVSSVARIADIPVRVMYRYRFFYMEPVILLEKDPLLKKMYFTVKKSRVNDFRKLFENASSAGIIIRSIRDDDFKAAFDNAWALNEFIIQSMYMNGEKLTEANMKRSFRRILYILKPFVCEEYREMFFPDNME